MQCDLCAAYNPCLPRNSSARFHLVRRRSQDERLSPYGLHGQGQSGGHEMTSMNWIDDSRATAPARDSREPRKAAGQSRSSPTLPPLILLSIWFGLVTGLLELGLVHARNHFAGLLDPQCLADQPALSLDDPARQPGSFSWLGPRRRSPWSGLEADRRTTERLSLELPRMPGSAAGVPRAPQDRLHRRCRGPRHLGGSVDLGRSRAVPPAGDHEPSGLVHGVLPASPDGRGARSRWASNGRFRHCPRPRGER